MLKSRWAFILSRPPFLIQSARCIFNGTNNAKKFDEIPGPLRLPFVGSSWKYYPVIGEFNRNNIDEAAKSLYDKYGPIVKQKAGSINVVHLFEPNDFETVYKLCHQTNQQMRVSFSALKSYRESKPQQYKTLGLLPAQGSTWWDVRKAVQRPISSLKQTRICLAQDDKIIKDFINLIGQRGEVEDFLPMGNKLNTELTLKYLFGERLDNFGDLSLPTNTYRDRLIESVLGGTDAFGYFDQAKLLWTFPTEDDHRKIKNNFLFTEKFVLEQLKKVKDRNLADDNCIVALLLKDPEFDEHDIGSIIDLVYGGIDTTAITTTFMLYEIGKDKRVQKKLRDEAIKLLPKGNYSEISEETLQQASYAKAVIRENFRLNPIVTTQNRQLPLSVELSGYEVLQDTIAILEIFVSCRQEKNFKNATKFQPERWMKSSEEYENSHPYSMLHFGLGLRTCIARRRAEQILLTMLLRVFSEYEVDHNHGEMKYSTPFLIKPSYPIKLSFRRITK